MTTLYGLIHKHNCFNLKPLTRPHSLYINSPPFTINALRLIELVFYLTPTMAYLFAVLEVLAVIVPVLLSVAFMTIIERKVLAAMQRRVGPNTVGVYGTLQPF